MRSNLPVVIVRPGNAYGEEQRAFAGQGFIATAMHSIIRGEKIHIFGAQGAPPRRFDVPANVLDIRKLGAVSGWCPQISFATGIERVWRAVSRSGRE